MPIFSYVAFKNKVDMDNNYSGLNENQTENETHTQAIYDTLPGK